MKRGIKIFWIVLIIFVILIFTAGIIKKIYQINHPDPSSEKFPSLVNGWILPENNNENYVWGVADGIAFGIQKNNLPPEMNHAPRGTWAPGLIYVMFTDEKGETYFFNYLGFSILGEKGLDQSEAQKIIFTPVSTQVLNDTLKVHFKTSEFEKNKLPINVFLSINKKRPREIEVEAFNFLQDSNPVRYIHVSATAGNLARLRNLYLKNEIINSKSLYANDAPGEGCFYPIKTFDLNKLKIDSSGIIVYAGNDEPGKWIGEFGSPIAPYYNKKKFFQYWRKYSGNYNSDLKISVNGRDRYFAGFVNPCGGRLVSGGVAYENFDMIEKYYNGQKFWFGYSYNLSA